MSRMHFTESQGASEYKEPAHDRKPPETIDDIWFNIAAFIPNSSRQSFASCCTLFRDALNHATLTQLQTLFPDCYSNWQHTHQGPEKIWASDLLKSTHQQYYTLLKSDLSDEQSRTRELFWTARSKSLSAFLNAGPTLKELVHSKDPLTQQPLWQFLVKYRSHWSNAVFSQLIAPTFTSNLAYYQTNHEGRAIFDYGPNGTKLFWFACAFQQHALVETMFNNDLIEHCKKSCYDNDGWGPLHHASMLGDIALIRRLLKAELNINATTSDGYTPLLIAIQHHQTEAAKLLLQHWAQTNSTLTDSGDTALHLAVKTGQAKLLPEIRRYRHSNVDQLNHKGQSPLSLACALRDSDAVSELLHLNANPNLATEDGETPLHIACKHNQPHSIRLLLRFKADLNARTTADGYTPLHIAIANGHASLANQLITLNADAQLQDNTGNTALHTAVTQSMYATVKQLLNNTSIINTVNAAGLSPLMLACKNGDTHSARLLINAAANIQLRDEKGNTALHYAAEKGLAHIVEMLLQHDASPHIKNEAGKTPYALARNQTKRLSQQATPVTYRAKRADFQQTLAALQVPLNLDSDCSCRIM